MTITEIELQSCGSKFFSVYSVKHLMVFMGEENRLIAGGDEIRGIGKNEESTEETIKPASWCRWEYGSDCRLL